MNKVSYTATPGGTCKLVIEADSPAEFDRLIRDFHDGFIPLSDNRTELFFDDTRVNIFDETEVNVALNKINNTLREREA